MAYSQLIPAKFRERLGLVLAFGALLALTVGLFNDAPNLDTYFLALRVNARVTVHGHNHGWPMVTLAHGASANRPLLCPSPRPAALTSGATTACTKPRARMPLPSCGTVAVSACGRCGPATATRIYHSLSNGRWSRNDPALPSTYVLCQGTFL